MRLGRWEIKFEYYLTRDPLLSRRLSKFRVFGKLPAERIGSER